MPDDIGTNVDKGRQSWGEGCLRWGTNRLMWLEVLIKIDINVI